MSSLTLSQTINEKIKCNHILWLTLKSYAKQKNVYQSETSKQLNNFFAKAVLKKLVFIKALRNVIVFSFRIVKNILVLSHSNNLHLNALKINIFIYFSIHSPIHLSFHIRCKSFHVPKAKKKLELERQEMIKHIAVNDSK